MSSARTEFRKERRKDLIVHTTACNTVIYIYIYIIVKLYTIVIVTIDVI